MSSPHREHRFFLDRLFDKHYCLIEGSEHHHLKNVLRLSSRDDIFLVNGQGALAKAKIENIERDKTKVLILSVERQNNPDKEIHLYQALTHFSTLDLILEKVTELNATHIYLFPSERSQTKTLSTKRLEQLKTKMIGALKQSKRLHLPKLKVINPLLLWKKSNVRYLFGSLRSSQPIFKLLGQSKTIHLCIGPEGGFTQQEEELLIHLQGEAFSLGDTVLRAETAAILAVGIAHLY